LENLSKKIEQMIKPYLEIQKTYKPILKIENKIGEVLLANLKATEQNTVIQKSLKEISSTLQKSFENINKIYSSMPKFKNPIFDNLETFKELGERLKEYAEKTPEYFLLIAQYGWFIDLDSELNFASKIAYRIQNDEIEKANELLVEYYKTNIDEIFKSLIKRHPNRKEIFEEILYSFKNNNHFTLIPTVLTQVDGICFDFTKKKFFIKDNKHLPQVTSELEEVAGKFLVLYLSPLQNQTPIMVREQDIHKFNCHLNRHEILHGINTNYGIEINSLKVISLLKYISDLLTDLDNKTFTTLS
jgi:hypothetical protein